MLMSNTDRPRGSTIWPMAFGSCRRAIMSFCAVTGRRIPLEDLKYWSAERQEAYADAHATAQVLSPQ